MKATQHHASSSGSGARILTFAIIATSSILFCSKGVVAKLAYAQGVDALTVLTLRMGLRRSSPQQFAIIGTVGPVATLLLAWGVLGERPNFGQVLGFALTLGGGLAISLIKNKSRD